MVAGQRHYNELQDRGLPLPPTMSPKIDGCWGNIYSPPNTPDPELRRQQAAFKKVVDEVSKQNAWMAIPALAPVAAVGVLEAAAAMSAPMVGTVASRGPLVLKNRGLGGSAGETLATELGRLAHDFLAEKVEKKEGWRSEPRITLKDGTTIIPDATTPPRTGRARPEPAPFYLELKPDTPSGRRAARRAVKKYSTDGTKTRPLYYDPNSISKPDQQ